MGSTTTGLLGLYKPAAQEQNWDASVNTDLDLIDSAAGHPISRAFGLTTWNYSPLDATATTSPTSQAIDVVPIWLPPGKVITNVVLFVGTVGTSTAPAHFQVGICSPSKIVAQSGALAASTSLTTLGPQNFALSATYTTNATDSATGLYYVAILEDGAFGSVNVAFLTKAAQTGAGKAYGAGPLLCGTTGTGQTALASNGTAITITAGTRNWCVGVS